MQKILIVEDDTNINNLLCEALTKEGYSCEQAFSGTEARLLLNMKEHGYALVLLDRPDAAGYPRGDGFGGDTQQWKASGNCADREGQPR